MINCCDRAPRKHGKDRAGFQRYRCPICKTVFTENPRAGKRGRKCEGDKPMTATERKRESRRKKLEKR